MEIEQAPGIKAGQKAWIVGLMRLQGVYTELITPFIDGRVDDEAVVNLIERQVAAGVAGVVVASGAAGEGMVLHDAELTALLDLAVRVAGRRIRVISGASSNSTSVAVELAQRAERLGLDAVMVTAPWYNRPGQAGVLQHFEQVAASVSFPILVGDAPARTGLNLQISTIAEISRLANVVGIVDASGDLARASAIRRACPNWCLLSGHDLSALGCIAHGASGVMSLTANVAPAAVVASCLAGLAGRRGDAERLQGRLFDLQSVLTHDHSPAPAKRALSCLGYCSPEVRLPILPWRDEDGVLAALLESIDA